MKRILFVCHGNICRSPMAEFVMKDLVKKAGLSGEFYIESAATSTEEIGNEVYPPARRKLAEHGISSKGKTARQMTRHDYDRFDLLIGMDSWNIRNMNRICGGDPEGKIHMLMDYTRRPGDVADPWYTGDFEATWQDVLEGCKGLLKKDNNEEIFPLVDEDGNVTGSATRGECHSGSRLLHPVVHLHVFNSRGEVYLQKRPEWKDIQPGKWDTAVGGHVDYGETPEEALSREVREELGITDFIPERIGKYVYDSRRERELVYVNRTTYDGPVRPSQEELDGGRFWTLDEIRAAIGKDVLTPNFESEFQRFFL